MKRTKQAVPDIELFLDSGAYSAWTKGIEIDINEYIRFIKKHENVINVYANLDVIHTGNIGGEASAEKTLENQRIMEEAGLNPLPVFHYGEPLSYLEKYLDEYDYISLGGMVPISSQQLMTWLDNLYYNYLTDDKGFPHVKVHGFGLTSLKLMLRYPWYSVDSTTWVIAGRTGAIYVPRLKNGEWVYNENPLKIPVSSRSPAKKDDPNHIDNLTPLKKEIILKYIHEKGYQLGTSEIHPEDPEEYKLKENERWVGKKEEGVVETIVEEGLINSYQIRDELNIIYYLDLEKSIPDWPWAFKVQTATSFF